MQVLRPIGFNGVTTAAPTLTLPKWTPWMVAAAHFNPCGVICCRNMWQRMPLVKNDSEKELRLKTEEAGVQLKVEAINEVLTYVIGDLKILASINAFNELWSAPTQENLKQQIAEVFRNISDERKIYDQIRLIDIDGKEIVRVDSYKSGCIAADSQTLQNKKQRPYFTTTINLNKGDMIYLTTDGFVDNPASIKGRRFGSRRLEQMLLEHQDLSMKEQKELLLEKLVYHQGARDQRDDITFVGLQI